MMDLSLTDLALCVSFVWGSDVYNDINCHTMTSLITATVFSY